jgi:hypothetical protein
MTRLLSADEILENDGLIMLPDNPRFYQILHSVTIPDASQKVGIVRHETGILEFHDVDSPEVHAYMADGEFEEVIYSEYDDF